MSSDTPDLVHGVEAERWGGWSWREPSHGQHYRTCSYCGSIHPDDLAAEPDWRAEWADAKYGWPHKFYVGIPNRTPEQKFIVAAHSVAREGPYAPGGERYEDVRERYPQQPWIRPSEIPDDVNTEGWQGLDDRYDYVQIGTRPVHRAKFYTTHLADSALGDEVRDRIQAVSGLRFRFENGRVGWEAYS